MCFAPPHLPFSSCPAGVPKHLPWVAVWKDESSIQVKWGMAGSAGPDREWWHAFPVRSVWSQVIVLWKPSQRGWKVSDSVLTTCWIVSLFEQPLPCKHQWVLKDCHFWKAMGQSGHHHLWFHTTVSVWHLHLNDSPSRRFPSLCGRTHCTCFFTQARTHDGSNTDTKSYLFIQFDQAIL